MITRLIVIILILYSTTCFSEERDKIRSYADDKGNTIYTNEHPSSQNKVPNTPSSNIINTFPAIDNRDTDQKQETFKPPVRPQPLPNYRAMETRALNTLAGIVAFQMMMLGTVFVLWLVAFIDLLRHEFTGSNKMIWFLTVTFIPIIGSILYFAMAGRHKIVPDKIAPVGIHTEPNTVPSGRKTYSQPDI